MGFLSEYYDLSKEMQPVVANVKVGFSGNVLVEVYQSEVLIKALVFQRFLILTVINFIVRSEPTIRVKFTF